MSEKSTIFKQHLFKKNHMSFFLIFTREFSHCTLQADKSFEPLPIILSEISHLQNCRVQNSNQRTNGPVNAHLISGPTVSTKKKQILTSIKGRNSIANLRNTIIYNTNIDLVNDDVYTKFGLIL